MSRGHPREALILLTVNLQTNNNMIRLNRPSTCAQLFVSPETNCITVQFKGSGVTETYTDVNSGDIENLLSDSTVSVGKFVNQVLLGRKVAEEAVAA